MSASWDDYRGHRIPTFTEEFWEAQREFARLEHVAELAIATQEAKERGEQ